MSAQQKSLLDRLDDLENNMGSAIYEDAETCGEAAAELRRLHALNAELLEALKQARDHIATSLQSLIESETNPATGIVDAPAAILLIEADQDLLNGIDATIAKAEGQA